MTSAWSGPSGEEFARMVRERLGGVPGVGTDVIPLSKDGSPLSSFLVAVEWPGGGLLCEVADSVNGVRVMDDNGEDVSIDRALDYVAARAAGTSESGAWRQARG